MQERTINNALIALARQGGAQGSIAEGLLVLREVPLPAAKRANPLLRGGAARLVLKALQGGPMTTTQIADVVRERLPDTTKRAAYNRAYQALLRLEEKGFVLRIDGAVWSASPPKSGKPLHSPTKLAQ